MSRILAVDWGERRIGLAISDPSEIIASGLPTLEVRSLEDAIAQVVGAVQTHGAELVVVGLPLLMSGQRGEAAAAAQKFTNALAARLDQPVTTYDERLTSAMSARRLRESGVRTGRNKPRVDMGAAIVLLESYLQRRAADARRQAEAE